MRTRAIFVLVLLGGLVSVPARADDSLSPETLEMLDSRGYFPPAFKTAVHDLVDARQAVTQAQDDEEKSRASVPGLRKEGSESAVRVADLQKELARYAHPEDLDYDALQKVMKDPAAKPEDKLVQAQAFVWTYPTDPRQPEAAQDLQQIQKELAAQQKALTDAAAARIAAREKLIERANARDLSLAEWRGFLNNMSQEELITFMGRPQTEQPDVWIYPGNWTKDPVTNQKVGLQIFFNGTRVNNVEELSR